MLILAAAIWLGATANCAASTVLLDTSGFVSGQQSFVQSFSLSGPGLLTVTLSSIAWPEKLADLRCFVTSASGILLPEMGVGTDSIEVGSGAIYAQWFGKASGPLNLGVFGIKLEFTPSAVAVPLPTSIILLASGLWLLAAKRRARPRAPA